MTFQYYLSIAVLLLAVNLKLGAHSYALHNSYVSRVQTLSKTLTQLSMAGKDAQTSPESGYEDKKKVQYATLISCSFAESFSH